MRNNRLKLTEQLNNKPAQLSKFSALPSWEEKSQRNSITNELEQFSQNHPQKKIDLQSFRAKHQRAIKLINENLDSSSKSALNILQYLCKEIEKLPENHEIPYDFLEKIVINCWRLKNKFKEVDEINRKQSLYFIRHYVSFFQQIYKKQQLHKHGLDMLYLIQANQEYEEKMPKQCLQSCEMSLKYSKGTKNQPHLLKVHYMKTKAYAALNNNEAELAEIKKCILYLNILSASNLTDSNEREYINNLKQLLSERKQNIHESMTDKKKSLDFSRKDSANKFRKRSISLKKQSSEKDLLVKKQAKDSPRNTALRIQTIHVKSANHSKHQTMTEDDRKQFLPVDINKFQKKTKLKKKAIKINSNYSPSNELVSDNIMDEIQSIPPPAFNHYDLMLRRPKAKKQQAKEEITNILIQKQKQTSQPKELALENKQSSYEERDQIQPVTHFINQSQRNQSQHNSELQHELLIRQCVKQSEQNLLRMFIKKNYHKQDTQIKIIEKENEQSIPSEEYIAMNTQLILNRSEISNHEELHFESLVYTNQDINVDENTSFCTYIGVVSSLKFFIRIEKLEHINNDGQIYKTLYINFKGMLNQLWNVDVVLLYPFYNPFEKKLEIIIDEINKRQGNMNSREKEDGIKNKLFNLITNKLVLFKKPNGFVLTQKNTVPIKPINQIQLYKDALKNRLIIFELNNFTKDFIKYQCKQDIYLPKREREEINDAKIRSDNLSHNEDSELNDYQQILNYYLPKLINRMTEDLREQNSSLSSVKRFKTEKFYKKDTTFSYKSTIKSFDESDYNTRLMYEDTKSLSLAIMPGDFNFKISNFFQHWEDVKQTSIPQFYYCMKFLLIKPPSDNPIDTLHNFYDRIEVEYLHKLKNNINVKLKMSCYKIKQIFKKKDCEYFYKFQIQFKGEKIKMMKFIATSKDMRLVQSNYKMIDKSRELDKNLKNSRKVINNRILKEANDNQILSKSSMLNLLKKIAPNIFVKKDYIYSVIGFETDDPYFNFINKFRLEGKTLQSKNFMIPHLKYINILLQKSIKINCECFKEYSVLTIRQIDKSIQFNIIFYIPKLQKTYSINLHRKTIRFLTKQDLLYIFEGKDLTETQIQTELFSPVEEIHLKRRQGEIWNRLVNLFKFETHYYEDKVTILLKMGNFSAFLKDSSFSEYFQLKKKIFHLQISVSKKNYLITSSEYEGRRRNQNNPKRKSSSSKELIRRSLIDSELSGVKRTGRAFKASIQKKVEETISLRKLDIFDKLDQIFQSDTSKYILYISVTQLHQISDEDNKDEIQETKKINYSFYLSDLINLLKDSKKQLYTSEEQINNEFNEQVFSFAILLRAMTIIKYKLIEKLKEVETDLLFEGEDRIQNQKIFKNKLNVAFNSQNENLYSLNAEKRLYHHENNIFIIHKHIMNIKKNMVVSIFYDEKNKKITFMITNNNDLYNKEKAMWIKDMHFPWIQFYGREHLFKINARIYSYYKNSLLLT